MPRKLFLKASRIHILSMALCGDATETVIYAVGQIAGRCALSLFPLLNAPGSRVLAEHFSRPDKVHRSV
jgi:hypothetical protein